MITLVIGRRRQGKSTLAFWLAKREGGGIVIYDPAGQYRRFLVVHDAEELDFAVRDKQQVIVYQPTSADIQGEFAVVADAMWDWVGFTFLIDEAWQVQTAYKPDEMLNVWLRKMDMEQTSLIMTVHRPRDVSTLARSVATDWYIFRSTHPRDLDVIEEQCGPSVREAVSQLPLHHYVHYQTDTESFEVISEPATWYESLRMTDTKVRTHA